MNATLQKLEQFGIVPVVVLDDAAVLLLWQKHSVTEVLPVRKLPSVQLQPKNPSGL